MTPTHITSAGQLVAYDRDHQYLWDAPHWSLQLRPVAIEPLPANATHWVESPGVLLRDQDEWCCGMWVPSGMEYDDRIALG